MSGNENQPVTEVRGAGRVGDHSSDHERLPKYDLSGTPAAGMCGAMFDDKICLRPVGHDSTVTGSGRLTDTTDHGGLTLIACTCQATHDCPEFDNPCPVCSQLDPMDPCPVVGFGCGNGDYPACDCCTPEQREAATSR